LNQTLVKRGVDALIKSVEDNGIGRNANVYAELGTTWRYVMRDPTTAAHLLGKLFKHIGEENVLWGSDALWYGSPQDQIQAFRSFQIAPALIEAHGYPELTPALKQKVFGLNGARVYGIDVPERRQKTETSKFTGSRPTDCGKFWMNSATLMLSATHLRYTNSIGTSTFRYRVVTERVASAIAASSSKAIHLCRLKRPAPGATSP